MLCLVPLFLSFWIFKKIPGPLCIFKNFEFLGHFLSLLAKVSDRNWFRANQNFSDSFRYLYPSQCETFRTNPKNVLYLVWWKTVKNRSDLIGFNLRQLSEWIRTNPKLSFQSESIRMNPRLEWFKLILVENSVWINLISDWFGLVRIHSDCCSD